MPSIFRKSRRKRPNFSFDIHSQHPHQPSIPSPQKFFVFYRLNSRVTHLRQIRPTATPRARPTRITRVFEHRGDNDPIFRLIYTHNTHIDLPSHPHESSPYFTDSTLVRPTLDKSTDSDTKSETDLNHPSFRKSRRQRPIFRLIYTHNTRIDLPSHLHEHSPYFTDSTLMRPTLDKSTDSDTESETVGRRGSPVRS